MLLDSDPASGTLRISRPAGFINDITSDLVFLFAFPFDKVVHVMSMVS
jgi:hypothetical protein